MLSKFFEPINLDGHLFDRGSILYEFDAIREPERTQFPQIGEWLDMRDFSGGAEVMVLASAEYDEHDYVRERTIWRSL